ncbi:galE [Mytilus coruscus]|uniref:UDP-N-acetylglucosamine 4-epimerase n=1 Tax=Mytilus coruscus TaxID=42192 RepID=A0A6J8EHT3_MYTCO|nr:galE [Mytilus coruscus]
MNTPVSHPSQISETNKGAIGSQISETNKRAIGSQISETKKGAIGSQISETNKGAIGSQISETNKGAIGSQISETNKGAIGSQISETNNKKGAIRSQISETNKGAIGSQISETGFTDLRNRITELRNRITDLRNRITDLRNQQRCNKVMKEHSVKNLIFSSSCTVYGDPKYLPVDENHPTGGCTNPYGKTKFFIEEILKDLWKADPDWNIVVLRYFNPVGAHKSGRIGEDPKCIPNLMPYCAQILVGKMKELKVYGNDYDTPDGTGVRDYIHISDVATGHVAAQTKVEEKCGLKIYNLGTGQGYSVMDMINAFSAAAGKPVKYRIIGRRPGDVASTYSKPDLAAKELGWKATRGLNTMCEDLWRWQTMNPDGFNSNGPTHKKHKLTQKI